jgi:glyoxylase-like metal-dependent hydrolase (beta-lactamase superfamily II)
MDNKHFQDHDFGITTIDTGFMRPHLAASYLLIENNHAIFIDVGTNYSIPSLLSVLQEKNIAVSNVDYVIVTHIHLDHAGGAGKLMQTLPNARLVVHPRGARHVIEPSALIAGVQAVYGKETFDKHYGDIIPIDEKRVIQAEDKHKIDFQGRQLLFLDTPGHARHHFCIFDERSQSFFTGDTFGVCFKEFDTPNGPFIFATTTPVQFEPQPFHHSIDTLLSYHPKKMYLTHYGEVTEVAKLAQDLHHSIDKQVDFVKSNANHGAQRHTLLYDTIMNDFLKTLQNMGCTIPPNRCRELLAFDAEMNTQGLEVWWDRKLKSEHHQK